MECINWLVFRLIIHTNQLIFKSLISPICSYIGAVFELESSEKGSWLGKKEIEDMAGGNVLNQKINLNLVEGHTEQRSSAESRVMHDRFLRETKHFQFTAHSSPYLSSLFIISRFFFDPSLSPIFSKLKGNRCAVFYPKQYQ